MHRELYGKQQQQAGPKGGLPIPQASRQIEHQRQTAEPGQQVRQQEGDAHRAGQLVEEGDGPHEHRGFVRVDLSAAEREQPLPGLHHLLGDQGKTGFVGRPGVSEPHAGAEHYDSQQQE